MTRTLRVEEEKEEITPLVGVVDNSETLTELQEWRRRLWREVIEQGLIAYQLSRDRLIVDEAIETRMELPIVISIPWEGNQATAKTAVAPEAEQDRNIAEQRERERAWAEERWRLQQITSKDKKNEKRW